MNEDANGKGGRGPVGASIGSTGDRGDGEVIDSTCTANVSLCVKGTRAACRADQSDATRCR